MLVENIQQDQYDETGGNPELLWIEKARQGNIQAYEYLYRQHVGKVHGLCLRLCGDKAMAEDYTQEAFILAWRKLSGFRGDSAFASWLYRIATNVVFSEQRKKSHWFFKWFSKDRDDAYDESINMTEHSESISIDQALDLEQAIRQLPKGARQVFVLHSIEGYRHEEIAGLLGIAVGSSKAQLHRARSLLMQWCDYD